LLEFPTTESFPLFSIFPAEFSLFLANNLTQKYKRSSRSNLKTF
jgi:hypothetical protein